MQSLAYDNRLTCVCVASGVYGATRGFRAERRTVRPTPRLLVTERVFHAAANFVWYVNPLVMPFAVFNLLNRIEVDVCRLEPDSYGESYVELFDLKCKHTW